MNICMNIYMNIRHLDMVESSAAEYSAAEVTFLASRAQYSAEEAPRFRVQSLERRIFGERWSASECSRCRHGCATSLHDDEDFKLGGKTVSEVRNLTSFHKKEHKNGGKIVRKKESSGSEDIIQKETRGSKLLKCMYANVRSI